MDASTIRRRYGELIQKIKSFRMAIGDYGSLLKVTDAKSKPVRVPSANRRTSNSLRPVSGRQSQTGKVGPFGAKGLYCHDASDSTPSHTLATGPLQMSTRGNILQNGDSFSLVDTITQARAMLNDTKQFRPFIQTDTAVPPVPVPRSLPPRVARDHLSPLQPISPRRKTTNSRPKSGRGQRPPSCRRRREAAPCSPMYQTNVHIESPKFIRLLYEDLLRALCLLRTQLGRHPATMAQERQKSDGCVNGLDVEWQQLDGLVSDLERQLRACEVRMLTATAERRVKTLSPPPAPALSPVAASECGSECTTDTTTSLVEPVVTVPIPVSLPWSRPTSLPSTAEWHQPIVPQNLCLRRPDSTLQASPRQKRLPRQAYPYGSSFPEVPPLPLLKQRTFVNVITDASPTIGVSSRKHVKPSREKTWSY